MLEATKIREMGLLGLIPENVVTEITVENDADGKTYTLELSNRIVKKIFNTWRQDKWCGAMPGILI